MQLLLGYKIMLPSKRQHLLTYSNTTWHHRLRRLALTSYVLYGLKPIKHKRLRSLTGTGASMPHTNVRGLEFVNNPQSLLHSPCFSGEIYFNSTN
jgi:hypothetical protein